MGAITTKADERINQGKKTVQEAFSLMIQKTALSNQLNLKTNEIIHTTLLSNDTIAFACSHSIQVYSLPKFKRLVKIKYNSDNNILYLTHKDNNTIIAADDDNNIQVWTIQDSKSILIKEFKAHFNSILKLVVLQNNYLITCSIDQNFKVWDNEYKCIKEIQLNEVINNIYQLGNGNLLVFLGNGLLKIYDINDYDKVKEINNVYCIGNDNIAELKDNRIMVYGHSLLIVNLKSMQIETTILTRNHIFSLCVLNERNILLGLDKGDIMLFRTKNYKIKNLKLFAHGLVITKIIKITEQNYITVSTDGVIKYWELLK